MWVIFFLYLILNRLRDSTKNTKNSNLTRFSKKQKNLRYEFKTFKKKKKHTRYRISFVIESMMDKTNL